MGCLAMLSCLSIAGSLQGIHDLKASAIRVERCLQHAVLAKPAGDLLPALTPAPGKPLWVSWQDRMPGSVSIAYRN